MDVEYDLPTDDRFGGLLFDKHRLAKSNEYYHQIHPTEAAAVDTALADERAKAEAKARAAAEAKAVAPVPATPAPKPAVPDASVTAQPVGSETK
jgi:NADH-quinone oxidoreductase subunit I